MRTVARNCSMGCFDSIGRIFVVFNWVYCGCSWILKGAKQVGFLSFSWTKMVLKNSVFDCRYKHGLVIEIGGFGGNAWRVWRGCYNTVGRPAVWRLFGGYYQKYYHVFHPVDWLIFSESRVRCCRWPDWKLLVLPLWMGQELSQSGR